MMHPRPFDGAGTQECKMGRIFIQAVDDVPWGPRKTGQPGRDGVINPNSRTKLIGDPDEGPWVFLVDSGPSHTTPVHSHSTDEYIYLLEGEMRFGDRVCAPGTLIFIEKDTVY